MDQRAPASPDATFNHASPIALPVCDRDDDVAIGPPSREPKSRSSRRKSSRKRVSRTSSAASSQGSSVIEQTVGAASGNPRSCSAPNEVAPPQIDNYRQLEELGRGGWGVVQRAFDRRLERDVAIKSLSGSGEENAQVRDQFEQEAKVTSQLQHPGIVPVHERGVTPDGKSFYAMKLLEGSSFRDVIHNAHSQQVVKTKAQLREVFLPLLQRFISVCNAVAFAHSQGIVHRDLKPANVMVGDFGETLVVDWGLATRFETEQTQLSSVAKEQELVGTPAFMSPEQAAGAGTALSASSDIYSLGVILFEIVAGVSPAAWAERTPSPAEDATTCTERVLERVIQGNLPSLRQANVLAPKSLEAVCRKAMSLNPDERYQTAAELAKEVSRFVEGGVPQVYNEPLLDKAVRWCINHKAITLVTLTALGVLLAASLVFGVAISQAHAKELVARKEAEASRQAALDRLSQARESADTWLIDLSGALEFYPGMGQLRRQLLESAMGEYDQLLESPRTQQGSQPASPTAVVRLNLERARLLLRVNDLKRLLSAADSDFKNESRNEATIVEAASILATANDILADSSNEMEDRSDFESQVRLEQINLYIAELLQSRKMNDEVLWNSHHAWLVDQLPPEYLSVSREGGLGSQSPLPASIRKQLSALVRLNLAGAQNQTGDQLQIQWAKQAVRFARIRMQHEPSDAAMRQLETAFSMLARLHSQLGDHVTAAETWEELCNALQNAPAPTRSDRLQSRAYAMMNQADAMAVRFPQESRALLDDAIKILYQAWDALDPSSFFETNLATANYNSAKLLLEESHSNTTDVKERLDVALDYYKSALQKNPTGDVLQRLAECHLLLGNLDELNTEDACNHLESAALALQLLDEHRLATTADLLLLAETQFKLSRLYSAPAVGQQMLIDARKTCGRVSSVSDLSNAESRRLAELSSLIGEIKTQGSQMDAVGTVEINEKR
ncbi:MAG: hypothetical protein Aurels2KO_37520 [Aureliella sp.]